MGRPPQVRETEYADYIPKKLYEPVRTEKSVNVAYWDAMEQLVQEAFEGIAEAGGIAIVDLKDLTDVKELTEEMMNRIKKQFPKAEWPYVDENY